MTRHLVTNRSTNSSSKGSFKVTENDKLNFGLGFTNVSKRSANVNHQNGDWGGVGAQGDYPSNLFTLNNLPSYFGQIKGSDDPRLFQQFYSYDFGAMRERAIAIAMAKGTSSNSNVPMTRAQAEAYFAAYTDFTKGNDLYTTEKSTSAYIQLDHTFDTAIPMNISVGLRQERTTIDSSSQVLALTGARWIALNEINVDSGSPTFGSASGSYTYLLPSIDWDADLTANIKVRASYGENIGRPGWGSLAGGVSVDPVANSGGGKGNYRKCSAVASPIEKSGHVSRVLLRQV